MSTVKQSCAKSLKLVVVGMYVTIVIENTTNTATPVLHQLIEVGYRNFFFKILQAPKSMNYIT